MLDFQTYDMIPPKGRQADAIAFDVPAWTNLAYVPGQTNLTGHSRTIIAESPIAYANVCFVVENTGPTPCSVRCVGLQYDENNQQVWLRTWGEVVNSGPNAVQQWRQQIKDGLAGAFASRGYVYVHTEVKGAGRLYMATAEVTWDKPDYIAQAAQIEALGARVTVLENAAPGGGNAGDLGAIADRTTAVEARLEAIRLALS